MFFLEVVTLFNNNNNNNNSQCTHPFSQTSVSGSKDKASERSQKGLSQGFHLSALKTQNCGNFRSEKRTLQALQAMFPNCRISRTTNISKNSGDRVANFLFC